MLEKSKVEKISIEVIKTLYSRFENFPEDSSDIRNAPFHMAFLEAFTDKLKGKVSNVPVFISLASWFHGLNTALGQSFFERTAHILSDGTKKGFKDIKISSDQQTIISEIISNLKNSVYQPNLKHENELLLQNNNDKHSKSIPEFTADCYFEEKTKLVLIELKTVKPNSSISKESKEKILQAKAGLQNTNPHKKIIFYIGFPFDPQSKTATGYNKKSFFDYNVEFKKFFDPDEVLLASELWDFLSGNKNTMGQILKIINAIATPKFLDEYEFLNNHANREKQSGKYLILLKRWNLFSGDIVNSCVNNFKLPTIP